MKNTVKKLLFLNPLSSESLAQLNSDPFLIVSSQPLIKIQDQAYDQKDLDPKIPWVGTSQNAAKRIQHHPLPKKIYCIGQQTASYFPHAKFPSTSTAHNLAQLIIENKETDLIYICGQKRREELPILLKSYSIALKEVIVYKTKTLKKSLNLQSIDGLAFMSPSAVYSFYENESFKQHICFAIGPSTAQALNQLGQQCIISKQTHAKSIVDAARQYFNT